MGKRSRPIIVIETFLPPMPVSMMSITSLSFNPKRAGPGSEALVTYENWREIHAADGAFTRLVRFDPGVHRTLVVEDFAFAGLSGGFCRMEKTEPVIFRGKPARNGRGGCEK